MFKTVLNFFVETWEYEGSLITIRPGCWYVIPKDQFQWGLLVFMSPLSTITSNEVFVVKLPNWFINTSTLFKIICSNSSLEKDDPLFRRLQGPHGVSNSTEQKRKPKNKHKSDTNFNFFILNILSIL